MHSSMPAGSAAVIAQQRKKKRAAKLKAKNEAKEAEIADWFKKYDKSQTGTMSRDEMREVLTAVKRDVTKDPAALVNDEILEEVMKYADVSGDGQIERQHLLAAIKKYKSRMLESEHMAALFAKHDADKSGDLDRAQLLTLLQEIAPPPHKHADESDADFVLERCDQNHSGSITFAELPAAVATWMDVAKDVKPETDSGGSLACVLL